MVFYHPSKMDGELHNIKSLFFIKKKKNPFLFSLIYSSFHSGLEEFVQVFYKYLFHSLPAPLS